MVPVQTSTHMAFTSSFIVLYCGLNTIEITTSVMQQGVTQGLAKTAWCA